MLKNDIRNADLSPRNSLLRGFSILGGLARNDNRWERGSVYDPGSGKSDASKMQLNASGTVSVSAGISFLWKTKLWTRA